MEKNAIRVKNIFSDNRSCYVGVTIDPKVLKSSMRACSPNKSRRLACFEMRRNTVVTKEYSEFTEVKLTNEASSVVKINKDSLLLYVRNFVFGEVKEIPPHIASKYREIISDDMEQHELSFIYEILKSSVPLKIRISKGECIPVEIVEPRRGPARSSRIMNITKHYNDITPTLRPYSVEGASIGNHAKQKIMENVKKLKRLRGIVNSIAEAEANGAYTENEFHSNGALGD